MREEGIKIIENFIIKDEPVMECEEMQAVVEMIYEIYKNTSGKERFCNGGT